MNTSQRHILINFDNKPNLFRLIFGVFTVYLLGITLVNFYQFGSMPTDENWFSTTSSKFYITKSFPALLIEHSEDKTEPSNYVPDSIRVGNLLLAVNKKRIWKYESVDLQSIFIPDDSMFTVYSNSNRL